MKEFEQSLLNYYTKDQLEHIQSVRVGIGGAGGLGSNCAMHLVRSGFRSFVIADFDRVELANLNRQFFFRDQVGWPKVEALKANLLRINPSVEIAGYQERLTASNITRIFSPCDIVVEAFDTAAAKRMIAEACAYSGKLFVAASGLAGWGKSDDIVVTRVNETFYIVGDGTSAVSARLPPCAPRVAVAAAKEADIVLAWVLRRVHHDS